MISEKTGSSGGPEPIGLLAFHVSEGHDRYTTLGGRQRVPALAYKVVETSESSGQPVYPVYEGRIFDAATGQQIHQHPCQSTFLAAFASWWERATGTEPPPELMRGATNGGGADER